MSTSSVINRGVKHFALIQLLLIPVGIAINIVGFQIAQLLRLPIFLDSIGTILAGAIGGPLVGGITGLLTNAINGIFNPVYFAYAPTSILVGLAAGLLAGRGMFTKLWKIIISGVVIMIIATISSGFITAIVFYGATGSTGSIITATILAAGQNIYTAVFSVQFFQEVGDKLISVLVVWIILKALPDNYLSKMRLGALYMKKQTQNLLADKHAARLAGAESSNQTTPDGI